jgi:hypothetical protein
MAGVRWRLGCVLAALIGIGNTAALAGAAAALDLERYRVTRPGEVLFRHAARHAELSAIPDSEREAFTTPSASGGLPMASPATSTTASSPGRPSPGP